MGKNKRFCVGDVIANGTDPREKNFCCGSIRSFADEGYWVTTPGGIGAGAVRVADRNAIDLDVIFSEHSDVEIIADIRYLSADHKLFCGGVVSRELSSCDRVCVSSVYGSAYIDRAHIIGGQEAVRMIFGRCSR
jgi:hypothetical protein